MSIYQCCYCYSSSPLTVILGTVYIFILRPILIVIECTLFGCLQMTEVVRELEEHFCNNCSFLKVIKHSFDYIFLDKAFGAI